MDIKKTLKELCEEPPAEPLRVCLPGQRFRLSDIAKMPKEFISQHLSQVQDSIIDPLPEKGDTK